MSVLRPFLCKAMTEEAWASLRQAKIVTVTDFLARDNEDIARTCGIDYKDVMSIGRVLLAQYSAFPVLASQLYSAALNTQAIFSSGFTSLDDLLEGGFYAGELCELTGETAAGKTQVCMRTAMMVAWGHYQSVVVIDTCGSWSSQAAAAFCAQYVDTDSLARCGEMEAALSRIHCVQAVDVYSLLSILEDLSSALTTQVQGPYSGARLVVVDSVTALFTPIQGGQQMDSLALLEQLGLKLKSLATEHSVAVLVTNSVRRDGRELMPCLGKVWAHTPHTRLLLHTPTTPSTLTTSSSACPPMRKASIISSVRMATGTAEAQIDLSSPLTPCLPR